MSRLSLLLGLAVGLVLRSVLGFVMSLLLAVGAFVVLKKTRPAGKKSPFLAREQQPRPARGRTDGPLSGIRVCSCSDTVAAPMASRILADLGAEVFKVEPPRGDMWRNFLFTVQPKTLPHSIVFDPVNVGKASVVVDYKTPEGLAAIKRLLKGEFSLHDFPL